MKIVSALLVVAALGMVGCHPSTEIGAIGYKNIGFEKQLSFKLVKPDGVTPIEVDTNHDGKLDSYVWEAEVTNDASKAYDYNRFLIGELSSLAREMIALAVMRGGSGGDSAPPTTQPSRSRLDELRELIAILKAEGILKP